MRYVSTVPTVTIVDAAKFLPIYVFFFPQRMIVYIINVVKMRFGTGLKVLGFIN